MSIEKSSLLDAPCRDCGFSIYVPLADIGGVAALGLYNDCRFPGRAVLVLNQHYNAPEDLPTELHIRYSVAGLIAIRSIADVTGARPVNFATLCNREPHVHSHIVPRQLAEEPRPGDPPWNDPRDKLPMPRERVAQLHTDIGSALVARFAEQDILTGLRLAEFVV